MSFTESSRVAYAGAHQVFLAKAAAAVGHCRIGLSLVRQYYGCEPDPPRWIPFCLGDMFEGTPWLHIDLVWAEDEMGRAEVEVDCRWRQQGRELVEVELPTKVLGLLRRAAADVYEVVPSHRGVALINLATEAPIALGCAGGDQFWIEGALFTQGVGRSQWMSVANGSEEAEPRRVRVISAGSMPPECMGVRYIVSRRVALAQPHREDLCWLGDPELRDGAIVTASILEVVNV